ncbi:MAG TPA: glutathione S-transferase family protein [Caulobacteraceae bacterium]|nr:glutathione S-transferase family protein [Caulobacteraceae bacterium]
MTITLYGGSRGRASRSLLALEELGVAYEHVPLEPWDKPEHRETLLRLNPNARVPTLKDGDFVLWESMAINLYLGDRFGGPLWPADPADRGRMYQWSTWAQTTIDVPARHAARYGADPERKARAEAERLDALGILDRALEGRQWLAGEAFTLADLNVAATLVEPWENGRIDGDLDPADFGLVNLADWLKRCTSRPSWERVRALP